MWTHDRTQVFAVSRVKLRVRDGVWAFAERHATEIEAHWARRARETPGFFNGPVFMMTDYSVTAAGALTADFVRTDFRSFLYWRETGWRDNRAMDAFGSALLMSADGRVLLGRQNEGRLNSGLCYPPSGFIDPRDVGADGLIDLDGSVAREVGEETGLPITAFARAQGYIVTIAGPSMSIAVPLLSPLSGDALFAEAARRASSAGDGELAQLVLLELGPPPAELPMLDYARALLANLPRFKIAA